MAFYTSCADELPHSTNLFTCKRLNAGCNVCNFARNIKSRLEIIRDFFRSIPEDFGNRCESTITKLPMRSKQWQKHRKKDQTTANRMTVFCFVFFEVGTAVWPREFCHFVSKANSRGKIPVVKFPWPYRGSYFEKKKTPSFDSPCFFFKANSRGKIPVAIPRFLLRKKKKHRHSIRRGLVFLMVLLPLFIPHW